MNWNLCSLHRFEESSLLSVTYFCARLGFLASRCHTTCHIGTHKNMVFGHTFFFFCIKMCLFICLQVMHDVHGIISELSESGNFIGHVHQLLSSCPTEVLNLVKQSILQAVEPLKELLPAIMNVMIGVIVRKSNEVSRPP
jgi:hypothetical protein